MQRADLRDKKIKRVLYYWRALYNDHKLQSDEVLTFISEIFCISEDYIWKEYILKYNLEEMEDVKLDHLDLDLLVISGFVDKIRTRVKKEHKSQFSLFHT